MCEDTGGPVVSKVNLEGNFDGAFFAPIMPLAVQAVSLAVSQKPAPAYQIEASLAGFADK
mgnify:CR=1 FL=1